MTKFNKIISGEVFDASGHTDFTGSLDEAMEIIMDNVKNAGKWAYINGNPFIFQNFDAAEQDKVRTLLDGAQEPHFLLTGKLQGGALVAGSRKAKAAGRKAAATRAANIAKIAAKTYTTAKVKNLVTAYGATPIHQSSLNIKHGGCPAKAAAIPTVAAVAMAAVPTHSAPKIIGRITSNLERNYNGSTIQLYVRVVPGVFKDNVEIVVSDFAGGRASLQKYHKEILAGIYNALRPEGDLKADAKANSVKG